MANNIINLILTAAGYILGLFDQMLSATGLFGWFTFCFFTFTVFRFLLVPLFGRALSVGQSDDISAADKARKGNGFEFKSATFAEKQGGSFEFSRFG